MSGTGLGFFFVVYSPLTDCLSKGILQFIPPV